MRNQEVEMCARARKGEAQTGTIDVSVVINRPARDIFDFYRDFRNLPTFLGDVMSVKLLGNETSRWTVQGPMGIKIKWTTEIVEEQANVLIRYHTLGGLGTSWEVQFTPTADPGRTEVREVMKLPLGTFGRASLALIGKQPDKEVAANLRRLKQVMETGKVTDTSYSVPGKFSLRKR